jgi:Tol biopolymer transport system component
MNVDGSNPVQLTRGPRENSPDCSPDGKWVLYTSYPQGVGVPTVWKISIEGGEPTQLTNKYSAEPKTSPDGRVIACWYRGDDVKLRSRIAIIPAAGGAPIKVFERPPNVYLNRSMRWTPDGQAIIFTAGAGTTSNIWRQPIDGGPPVQLTNINRPDLIFSFDLSRDGRQIVYSMGRQPSDAVLISDFR